MRNKQNKFVIVLCVALALGLATAWIDTRPHWDDTGISVVLITLSSVICGYFAKQKPWLIAVAVGVWIPLFNIVLTKNFGSILALLIAFIAVYTVTFVQKLFQKVGN